MKNTYLCSLLLAGASAASSAATYHLDPLHTNVTFEIDHILSTNRGKFDKKEGVVEFDRQARKGSVNLTIDATSINTGIATFNTQLRSKDYFNVEQYPTVKFSADRFVFEGDKVVEVIGDLTMLGKTHPVKLKSIRFGCIESAMLKREVCGGDFEATINRSLWGMETGLPRFPDNVRLLLQVEAIKQ